VWLEFAYQEFLDDRRFKNNQNEYQKSSNAFMEFVNYSIENQVLMVKTLYTPLLKL
jgi:hypothetical protein